jgi:hypothetical protein
MAEYQKLAGGPRFLRPPSDAQLIAAEFLCDALDVCSALAPLGGENVAAAIGRNLFKTWRFCEDKPLDRGKHLRHTVFQAPQEFLGIASVRHGRDMLTICSSGGNVCASDFGAVTGSSARQCPTHCRAGLKRRAFQMEASQSLAHAAHEIVAGI